MLAVLLFGIQLTETVAPAGAFVLDHETVTSAGRALTVAPLAGARIVMEGVPVFELVTVTVVCARSWELRKNLAV
jgi:hypothetical protein